MEPYFAVVHDTVTAFVYEFNRVLDGQDMVFAMRIRVINQGCQGRRFAAPSRAGHQYETFGIQWQFVEDWWQAELLHRQNRIWNLAKHCAHAILLHEVVGTVARQPGNLVSEIDVTC